MLPITEPLLREAEGKFFKRDVNDMENGMGLAMSPSRELTLQVERVKMVIALSVMVRLVP